MINLKLDAVKATIMNPPVPEVTKGVADSLEIVLYDSDGTTPYDLSALGVTDWEFSISNNWLPEVPILVEVLAGITADTNTVTVPISALQLGSDELVTALSNMERKKFTAELKGSDTGIIFLRTFDIYCNNRLSN